jgi:hypothetical protein
VACAWTSAVACRARASVQLEPNRRAEQLDQNLRELVGHLPSGRHRDASSLGRLTRLGRPEQPTRACRVLVLGKEHVIAACVRAAEDPGAASRCEPCPQLAAGDGITAGEPLTCR